MSIKETHYDIFNLNRLFAMSSLFLFFLILWTFADDYVRSWKDYQKEFRKLESNLTVDLLNNESSRILELEDYNFALEELEKSQIDLNAKKVSIDSIGNIISKLKDDQFKYNQELGFAKSVYDVAKFEYEYAVTYYSSKKIESAKKNMDLLYVDVEKNTLLVQEIEAALLNENNQLSILTSTFDESNAKVSQLEMQKSLYERKLKTVDPNSMTLPNKIANFIRDLPILDLSNPYYKINQVIIPDIKENMIFAEVSRVDRCMTCHLGIDKKGYEDAPQPYTTHPNLDLYVSSASAHSNEEFGCTSCHAGRGRGTDFTTSTHTPSSPEQEKEWVEKYDWKEMHHWQTPMYPSQHYEAGCLKCHSSEASIPESKDLNIGLALFEKASCNGCHYVERYDGNLNQRIGPNLTHLSSKTDREWTYRWVINPQNFRHNTWMPNFFELMDWENEADSLRTNQEIHAIVDYLFDNSQPFNMEKNTISGDFSNGENLYNNLGCKGCHQIQEEPVEIIHTVATLRQEYGPNLIGLGSKTNKQWLFNWLKNPKNYHPETLMPNLRLSDKQAADLTSYLLEFKNDEFMSTDISPVDEDIQSFIAKEFLSKSNSNKVVEEMVSSMSLEEKIDYNGSKLVQHYGCTGCHVIPGYQDAKRIGVALDGEGSKPLNKLDFGFVKIPHNRISWFKQKIKYPRSFDKNKVAGPYDGLRMPKFGFSDYEAEKITTYILALNNDPNKLPPATPKKDFIEKGQWVVKQNNCMGCHIMEGKGGDILAHYETNPEYGPPNLNTEGAKVHPDWLLSFFENPNTIRPNIMVRMPSFGLGEKKWNDLISYFQYWDNQTVQYEADYIVEKNNSMYRAGKVIHDMGACNSCHFYGEKLPTGDPQTWAPNLALSKSRLRADWLVEWFRNPQQIMPGTKMPKPYIPSQDELTTADASEIFGTDLMQFAGKEDDILRGLTNYVYTIPGKQDISNEISSFFEENGYDFLNPQEETDEYDDYDDWGDDDW